MEPTSQDNIVQNDIASLKKKLDELNAIKEEWYSKKESIAEKIKQHIDGIKNNREERNQRTSEVRNAKVERDKLNDAIKTISQNLQALRKKKDELFAKHDVKGNPQAAQRKIDELETKLETEVMSFDKEKALNKQVRELKAQTKGANEVKSVLDEIRDETKKLRDLRKDAKAKHLVVQNKASESQGHHESLLSSSKVIDDLRKQEEEAFKEFMKFKQEFNTLNDQLKLNLASKGMVRKKEDVEKKRKKAAEDKKDLAQKGRSVEEKIKKKEKLTTEDLLVFQQQ